MCFCTLASVRLTLAGLLTPARIRLIWPSPAVMRSPVSWASAPVASIPKPLRSAPKAAWKPASPVGLTAPTADSTKLAICAGSRIPETAWSAGGQRGRGAPGGERELIAVSWRPLVDLPVQADPLEVGG